MTAFNFTCVLICKNERQRKRDHIPLTYLNVILWTISMLSSLTHHNIYQSQASYITVEQQVFEALDDIKFIFTKKYVFEAL
jgi:hypothetical protein